MPLNIINVSPYFPSSILWFSNVSQSFFPMHLGFIFVRWEVEKYLRSQQLVLSVKIHTLETPLSLPDYLFLQVQILAAIVGKDDNQRPRRSILQSHQQTLGKGELWRSEDNGKFRKTSVLRKRKVCISRWRGSRKSKLVGKVPVPSQTAVVC
jgi:hypothetical protein